jgi:hypothetical protein
MTVLVLEDAAADLEAGRRFYESREQGVGEYFTAAAALRAIEGLEPRRQFEMLEDVRAEAERAVRAQLGDEAFAVYVRGADWLKALSETGAGR